MFLRCANPQCTSQFDYREGQLIRVPHDDGEMAGEVKPFWLCGACAGRYYLEYRQGEGVIMARHPLARVEREASRVAAA